MGLDSSVPDEDAGRLLALLPRLPSLAFIHELHSDLIVHEEDTRRLSALLPRLPSLTCIDQLRLLADPTLVQQPRAPPWLPRRSRWGTARACSAWS